MEGLSIGTVMLVLGAVVGYITVGLGFVGVFLKAKDRRMEVGMRMLDGAGFSDGLHPYLKQLAAIELTGRREVELAEYLLGLPGPLERTEAFRRAKSMLAFVDVEQGKELRITSRTYSSHRCRALVQVVLRVAYYALALMAFSPLFVPMLRDLGVVELSLDEALARLPMVLVTGPLFGFLAWACLDKSLAISSAVELEQLSRSSRRKRA